MATSMWSTYSSDQLTGLDTISPSTSTEHIDVSRLFRRLSATTTTYIICPYTFESTSSDISVDNSSIFPRVLSSHTTTVSQKTIPAMLRQQHERERRLWNFLWTAVQTGEIRSDTANLAWEAWKSMKASVQGMLAVPDAGISPDGEVLFLWKKEAHHFELEVLPNGQSELFYINHHSDEMWEYDYDVATTLPGEVIHQLTPFLLYDN